MSSYRPKSIQLRPSPIYPTDLSSAQKDYFGGSSGGGASSGGSPNSEEETAGKHPHAVTFETTKKPERDNDDWV